MSGKSRKKHFDIAYAVERLILKAVIAGILLLIAFQALMLNDTARVFLNYTTRLEGDSLQEAGLLSTSGKIIVKMENQELYPEAMLLVNGEPVARFDRQEVEVEVKNNDLLELDASRVKKQSLYFTVVGVSDNVLKPSIGMRVSAKNKIEVISRVKLK